MTNNKRGGTLRKRKSSKTLSSDIQPEKKTKLDMGLKLDLGEAEKVRADINREDDDKLFLQRKREKNLKDIEKNKEQNLYLSPLLKNIYEHTDHDQIKRTPQKLYEEWQQEEELGEYADASEAGVTLSALRPNYKAIYSDDVFVSSKEPKNLFKGGRRKKRTRKSKTRKQKTRKSNKINK